MSVVSLDGCFFPFFLSFFLSFFLFLVWIFKFLPYKHTETSICSPRTVKVKHFVKYS